MIMNRGRWSETEVVILPERCVVLKGVANQCCSFLNYSGRKSNSGSKIVFEELLLKIVCASFLIIIRSW